MPNVSIYGKSWIDLVFEGRNKSYGAYRLRLENERTTRIAFLLGIFITAAIVSIPLAANYEQNVAISATIPDLPTVIKLTDIRPQPPKPQVIAAVPLARPKTDEKRLKNIEIVRTSEADQNIVTNIPPSVSTANSSDGAQTVASDNPGTTVAPVITVPVSDDRPVNTAALDKLPEFPGGIQKFREYVGLNFQKPEFEINEKMIRVFISFVIEKDGSMTDIRVIRDPGYGMGKEAIRVLKSLKAKWEPGRIGGRPVRTAYNMPILLKIEN